MFFCLCFRGSDLFVAPFYEQFLLPLQSDLLFISYSVYGVCFYLPLFLINPMKFAIGIPTYNRFDLLKTSLLSYDEDFEGVDIFVVDNGKQKMYDECPTLKKAKNVHILEQDYNLGVAASWNLLCKIIFNKYPNALIVNDDVYLGYRTDVVEKAIDNSSIGLVQSDFNWSVFLISHNLYEFIGEFDEDFYPAYFEDSDYIYRVKMKGLWHEVDHTLSPLIKRSCSTSNVLDTKIYQDFFQRNRARYIKKWGNPPLLELYKTPFDK